MVRFVRRALRRSDTAAGGAPGESVGRAAMGAIWRLHSAPGRRSDGVLAGIKAERKRSCRLLRGRGRRGVSDSRRESVRQCMPHLDGQGSVSERTLAHERYDAHQSRGAEKEEPGTLVERSLARCASALSNWKEKGRRSLSPAAFSQILAPQVGLEPTTLRLTAECSAIELLRNKRPQDRKSVV